MYLGWPTRRVVAAAAIVSAVLLILTDLTGSFVPSTVAILIGLVIAARVRAKAFRDKGGLEGGPDRNRKP